MKCDEIIEAVQQSAELDTREQAREAVTAVLSTCARSLPAAVRHQHAQQLPGLLEESMEPFGRPHPLDGSHVIAEVGWRLEVEPTRACRVTRAVLKVLRIHDPDFLADLTAHLGADVVSMLAAEQEPTHVVRATEKRQ
ncbi:DUF2267 domain-containing protein [Nocardia sp. NPDC004860]|uniref:DUF2267 domain-containing protein n=1 Tax=Nocardia sp. NPDC004860 TaxID=3154557 RepID=UPI0033B124CC